MRSTSRWRINGPTSRFLNRGVTDALLLRQRDQPIDNVTCDRPVNEHPLHRHANLPGVVEPTLGKQRQRVVEIRIGGDDDRRCTAVLERTPRARGELGAQHPADAGAADEAEEPHPFIGNELGRNIQVVHHQRLAPLLGQTRLAQDRNEAGSRTEACPRPA